MICACGKPIKNDTYGTRCEDCWAAGQGASGNMPTMADDRRVYKATVSINVRRFSTVNGRVFRKGHRL